MSEWSLRDSLRSAHDTWYLNRHDIWLLKKKNRKSYWVQGFAYRCIGLDRLCRLFSNKLTDFLREKIRNQIKIGIISCLYDNNISVYDVNFLWNRWKCMGTSENVKLSGLGQPVGKKLRATLVNLNNLLVIRKWQNTQVTNKEKLSYE